MPESVPFSPTKPRRQLAQRAEGAVLELTWPVVVPDHLPGGMAATIERQRATALHGPASYPPEWPGVAWLVKTIAGWRCERCGHAHTPAPPWVLTVHHLDGDKSNLQSWNLSALCQRCHLRIQNRVIFQRPWPFEHSPWMARHVAEYNEWALLNGQPPLPLNGIAERSYENEWPDIPASRRRAKVRPEPGQLLAEVESP